MCRAPAHYNSSNQLTSTSDATFGYDADGNTTSKLEADGTTIYQWDYEDRLTSVTLPGQGGTISFKYDPFGRRIRKSSPAGVVNYLYDGANIVTELDAAGGFSAGYAQGLGIDEPLAMLRGSGVSYYQADGLGSVTSVTDASGAVAASYTYDAFGNITSAAGNFVNPFRYTGREWDAETGLYYYRARYYDPQIGRFISEDPLAFNAGVNFYGYVRGNPVMATDPMDLYDWKDVKPAWDHYCDGSGTPWTTSFASINWGDTQHNISIKVKGMVGGGCSNRTIPVSFTMNAQTAGADAYIIGRHMVNVKGTIQVNCDCTWSFKGDMSSKLGYDRYDFDPSNRGTVGETLTWIGSHRCSKKGKPFNINLTGSVALSAGGKVDGKPTCDCDKNK